MTLKISIITPAYNAGKFIEDAIKCVQQQNYPNFEHIIIDAGSTDDTLKILNKYPHLKWISEKDDGQSDAMNKGFDLSTGDIIGYLNADDYYNPDVFNTIVKYFNDGALFVQGKIKVEQENSSFINDAKTNFHEIIRHWEPEAFCVNPVGYFYRREVQQKVGGFDINNHFSMDLQFLIGAAKYFPFTRVSEDIILGVFRYYEQTKTARNQFDKNLWSPKTFWYIDDFLHNLPEKEKKNYYYERNRGYKTRREQQEQENTKTNIIEKIKNKLIKLYNDYA